MLKTCRQCYNPAVPDRLCCLECYRRFEADTRGDTSHGGGY